MLGGLWVCVPSGLETWPEVQEGSASFFFLLGGAAEMMKPTRAPFSYEGLGKHEFLLGWANGGLFSEIHVLSGEIKSSHKSSLDDSSTNPTSLSSPPA